MKAGGPGVNLVIMRANTVIPYRRGPSERALCRAIAAAVLRLAAGRAVTSVRVRAGSQPFDPGLCHRYVRQAVTGTLAGHAVIEITIDPATVRCRECGNETAVSYALALLACRQCGSFDIEVAGTQDVVLEDIGLAA